MSEQCPKCGSTEVIPIVYGYPMPNLMERVSRGEVKLGGCIVVTGDNGPTNRHCKTCGHAFRSQSPSGDE